MGTSIYKYQLEMRDDQTISMPRWAFILSAQQQKGTLCLWAAVDRHQMVMTERRFIMVGTGHEVPELITRGHLSAEAMTHQRFIGTVQFEDGGFVFHLFEVTL